MIDYIVLSSAGFVFILLILLLTHHKKAIPMLWKIEHDPPSYLLASLHAGIHKNEIHRQVWQKLKQCQVVVFENRCDEEANEICSDYSPVKEVLGETYWQKVQKLLGLCCAKQIEHCEVWELGVILTYRAYPDGQGLEKSLKQKARNKAIRGLESCDVVPQILRKIYRVEMIKELLDNDPKPRIHKMVDAYKSGNIQALEKEHLAKMNDTLKEKLVWQRNKNWLAQIENHIQNGNALIVVGAFHLIGEHSVVALLKNNGYVVRAVTMQYCK